MAAKWPIWRLKYDTRKVRLGGAGVWALSLELSCEAAGWCTGQRWGGTTQQLARRSSAGRASVSMRGFPHILLLPLFSSSNAFLREYECCVDEIRQKFATVFSHLLSRSSPSVTNIVHLILLRSIMLFYTWIFAPWEKLYQCQRVAAWKGRCTIYLWQIRIWKEKTANKLKYINSTILSNWNMQIWKPGIVTENY